MSDFTIGFYEIIYNNILDKKILDEEGKIINKEFSGDTMNSFNVIANRISVAGKTKKERTTINVNIRIYILKLTFIGLIFYIKNEYVMTKTNLKTNKRSC